MYPFRDKRLLPAQGDHQLKKAIDLFSCVGFLAFPAYDFHRAVHNYSPPQNKTSEIPCVFGKNEISEAL